MVDGKRKRRRRLILVAGICLQPGQRPFSPSFFCCGADEQGVGEVALKLDDVARSCQPLPRTTPV